MDGRALVTAADIFSPNEREAISLVGPGPPLELIGRLVELGAEVLGTTYLPACHLVFVIAFYRDAVHILRLGPVVVVEVIVQEICKHF